MSIMMKMKRLCLAGALLMGMGMGVAEAYDTCYTCPREVVVVRKAKPKRVRRRVCRQNPCYTPVRRVYRVETVEYVEAPRAVYYEPAPIYRYRYDSAPVYAEPALPAPPPCSSCP